MKTKKKEDYETYLEAYYIRLKKITDKMYKATGDEFNKLYEEMAKEVHEKFRRQDEEERNKE